MKESVILKAVQRERTGSRDARKLRSGGRLPASLQGDGESEAVSLHIEEEAFLASRRAHVHLYDIEFGGRQEAAVVRELQWDTFGDRLLHVDFKRVDRGVETEAEVELEFHGQPAAGVLNHFVTHITIRTIPSNIPDSIVVRVGDLEIGKHVRAGDLVLPEGVSLAVPPTLEVAVVSAPRAESVTPAEFEEAPSEGEAPPAPEREKERE